RSSRTYHSDTLLSWTFLVNEETQDENMVLDEENNVDGQDYEPRNDFDLSMFDENCKEIDLYHSGVDDIPDFSRFSKLECLLLDCNLLTSIRDGSMPRTLVRLKLCHNEIDEIRGLDELTNLTDLNLSNNKLRKITGIAKHL
ncbi:Protein T09A5.9, partial [Aphelenchoides avenae]